MYSVCMYLMFALKVKKTQLHQYYKTLVLRQEWALMRFIAMDVQKKKCYLVPSQLWEQTQCDAAAP